MENIKEKISTLTNTKSATSFVALAGIATVVPIYIHLQWVTGPMVNAILIITLFLVGIRSALLLCLIPSMIALAGGLLPAILAPVVPFIMLSNVIFILTVDRVYSIYKDSFKGFFIGISAGAFLKFIFLFFSVNAIGNLLIKQELVVKVAQMMSWPQFATALTGGMIAWVALRWLKKI